MRDLSVKMETCSLFTLQRTASYGSFQKCCNKQQRFKVLNSECPRPSQDKVHLLNYLGFHVKGILHFFDLIWFDLMFFLPFGLTSCNSVSLFHTWVNLFRGSDSHSARWRHFLWIQPPHFSRRTSTFLCLYPWVAEAKRRLRGLLMICSKTHPGTWVDDSVSMSIIVCVHLFCQNTSLTSLKNNTQI